MSSDLEATALPADPGQLQALVAELLERVSRLERENRALEMRARELFRKLYGRKSEKLQPGQLELVFEAMIDLGVDREGLEEIEVEVVERRRTVKGKPRGRKPLPAELPRERVEHPLPEAERQCSCCGAELTKIREEVSEQLEYTPASFKVIEHVRGVYACKGCEESITRAPKPPQAIDKGLPGPGLLAHVVVSKYADHLPLYRQQTIYRRHGIDLSRSTLCCWVAEAAGLAAPLYEWLRADVVRSRILATDDTPVPVLDRESGGTYKGRLWVYLGDGDHPHVVFDFTASRERSGPAGFLGDFHGYLQADAYGGYDGLYAGGAVREVACWAHARRYFYDAAEGSGDRRAYAGLAFIRQLFALERGAAEQGLDGPARGAMRRERALPILDAMRGWLDERQADALPKSALGKAVGYTLNQWDALVRYTEDGDLAIDNSATERALRAVAVGRKNWIFAGSDNGGRRAATLYTLIATAKRHGLEPFAYLRDLFARLPTHPLDRIDELAPHRWTERRTDG